MVSGLVMSKVIGTYSFNTRFMKYQEDSYESVSIGSGRSSGFG